MACKYLSNGGNCGALVNVEISGGVAHFCEGEYENCPRYQFVEQQNGKMAKPKE